MELVAQVKNCSAVKAVLAAGVDAVALQLPRNPDVGWWSEAEGARAAIRRQGAGFYLAWEWLVPERRWPEALDFLKAAARLTPEALVLRDLGLAHAARQLYPDLALHASGRWGCHNSLGLRQAADLGFQRVVLEAPLHLPELAVMRRACDLPLQMAWTAGSLDFSGLSLLEEFLKVDQAWVDSHLGLGREPGSLLLSGLELLPGYAQLGVEAVHLGPEFSQGDTLKLLVPFYRQILSAAPAARPQVLEAARQVLTAFGAKLSLESSRENPGSFPVEGREDHDPPPASANDRRPPSRKFEEKPKASFSKTPSRARPSERSHVWIEVRGFAEVAVLGRNWRGPVVVPLTPENYQSFLPEHHRWEGRRLIWRLPGVMRETAVPFYRQALMTLRQGGYGRFIVGDWGAAALVREAGGRVYGDQTLGVRNLRALEAARQVGVAQVCLPPGESSQEWQVLLEQTPANSFWGYLLQAPALAVYSREATPPREGRLCGPAGETLRWAPEEDLLLLCKKVPDSQEALQPWLQQQGVSPLVWSLPRTGLPWGETPPPTEEPRREGGQRRPPPRQPHRR